MTGLRLLIVTLLASLALLGGYTAAGGTRYVPTKAPDACREGRLTRLADQDAQFEQIGLVALGRAACSLGVSRAELTLALLDREALRRFERRRAVPPARLESAVRAAARRTLDDAARQKLIDGTIARVLGTAVATLPVTRLVDALNGRSNPCAPHPWRRVEGQDAVLTQVALIGLDRASCRLHVSPEQFAIALGDAEQLRSFEREHGLSDGQVEDAVRAGLVEGLDAAERADQLSGIEGFLARQAVERLPFDQLLNVLRTGSLDLPGL